MLYAQYLGEQKDGLEGTFSLFDIMNSDNLKDYTTTDLNGAIKMGVAEVRYHKPTDTSANLILGALNKEVQRAKQLNLMIRHGLERKGLTIEKRGDNYVWLVNKGETI